MHNAELIAAAIHEAAHCVVGAALGCRLVSVQIEPEPLTIVNGPAPIELWCLRALAGGMAERLLLGTKDVGDNTDLRHIQQRLGRAFDANIERLAWQAAGLVQAHAGAIEAVAAALLDTGALIGSQVADIIGRGVRIHNLAATGLAARSH